MTRAPFVSVLGPLRLAPLLLVRKSEPGENAFKYAWNQSSAAGFDERLIQVISAWARTTCRTSSRRAEMR